jgi:hypothetical protein
MKPRFAPNIPDAFYRNRPHCQLNQAELIRRQQRDESGTNADSFAGIQPGYSIERRTKAAKHGGMEGATVTWQTSGTARPFNPRSQACEYLSDNAQQSCPPVLMGLLPDLTR